jgi:hypothetical protein
VITAVSVAVLLAVVAAGAVIVTWDRFSRPVEIHSISVRNFPNVAARLPGEESVVALPSPVDEGSGPDRRAA